MDAHVLIERLVGDREEGLSDEGLSLEDVLALCERAGLEDDALRRDLTELASERLLMWLVGDEAQQDLNLLERRNLVEFRLRRLVRDQELLSPALVKRISELQANITVANQERKQGLLTLEEPIIEALLVAQRHRCAVCGVPLSAVVRRHSAKFPGGMEPLFPKHLDHVLPFYLGSNSRNRQLLCQPCNHLKSDLLGVQEDGLVFSGNHLLPRGASTRRRRVTFWSLARSPSCMVPNCSHSSSSHTLWARRADSMLPWAYGNLVVECEVHAAEKAEYLHPLGSEGQPR